MRVAIVIDDPNYFGGGNKFASDLIRMLKRYDYEISLCAWRKPIEGRCHESFLETGNIYLPSPLVKIVKGKLLRIALSLSSAIKRCVRNFKPDVIINANTEPAAFNGVQGGVKKILYCHFPTELKLFKHDLLHLIYRIPYWYWHYKELSMVDAIICNSNYTRNIAYLMWKYYVSKDRFHVIYPAVDVNLFTKNVKRERKICYVGRIDKNKGIEYVIDSFLKIYKRMEISLEIVGGITDTVWSKHYYENKLKPLVQNLQEKNVPIRLKVNVPYSQIIETLLSSKAMISFNPEEHFGIVPVEAQAAGCIPIVAKGGGQLETIRHEETGFLVEDPEKIVKYAIMLFEDEDLWLKMSNSAKKWATRFSLEKISEEWNSILNSLINRRYFRDS